MYLYMRMKLRRNPHQKQLNIIHVENCVMFELLLYYDHILNNVVNILKHCFVCQIFADEFRYDFLFCIPVLHNYSELVRAKIIGKR